jgi:hypothetical protein
MIFVCREASSFLHSWLKVGGWVLPLLFIPYTFKHAFYIYISIYRTNGKRGEEGSRN